MNAFLSWLLSCYWRNCWLAQAGNTQEKHSASSQARHQQPAYMDPAIKRKGLLPKLASHEKGRKEASKQGRKVYFFAALPTLFLRSGGRGWIKIKREKDGDVQLMTFEECLFSSADFFHTHFASQCYGKKSGRW